MIKFLAGLAAGVFFAKTAPIKVGGSIPDAVRVRVSDTIHKIADAVDGTNNQQEF